MAVRIQRSGVGVAVCAVLLATTGCGGSASDDRRPSVQVVANPTFALGSTMEKLHSAGTMRIGVTFDQPGLGYRKPGSNGAPEGFDIDIAKIIAGRLGIAPDKIKWVETEMQNRERYLRDGTVDLVLASYSITPERRKQVGMAGPYYVTGQQLLVRKDDKRIKGPQDIEGKRVCSASGTTSIHRVEEQYHAKPVPYGSESTCVHKLLSGSVDAATHDGALLLGYAAERPTQLKVVGKPFSTERYGVGYRKGDTGMCEFINRTLTRSYQDGTWVKALSGTLWKTSGAVPYPDVDPCPQ